MNCSDSLTDLNKIEGFELSLNELKFVVGGGSVTAGPGNTRFPKRNSSISGPVGNRSLMKSSGPTFGLQESVEKCPE